MDGNRRWAKKWANVVKMGHKEGGDTSEKVLEMCLESGIPFVSMWALSKENILERSEIEIRGIYELLLHTLPKLLPKLISKWVRFETIGDLWLLPSEVRTLLFEVMEQTQGWSAITFIFAIGYSGQDEIVRGVKRCISEGIDPTTLSEKGFLQYLDSGKYPPPDLIVRTGGNIRHSGFFLYHSAYSEYYFTETLWPDFDQEAFDKVIQYYDIIQRNFGK